MPPNSGIRTTIEFQTNDFTVAEKHYWPGTMIGSHSHDCFVISLPLAGSFVESNSLSKYTCERDGLSVNPAGENHINNFSHGAAKCLVITSKTDATTGLVRTPRYVRDITSASLARRIHRESRKPDAVSPLMVQGLILEMLAGLTRKLERSPAGKPPLWLTSVRDHIRENLSEACDLEHLAHIAGVHPTTLCRQFRRYYEMPVGDFVRELRIDRSMTELSYSDKSIAEIAFDAGFYDQSHFSNAFKRHTGMTPSEFRRR